MFNIDKDAFSSGQISSKLWLCQQLELLEWRSNETWIYGGWYAVTAFLLLSRNKFSVDRIRSFDIDPSCQPIADMINENWIWQSWKFKAETKDCNQITNVSADLIINTSTEHFDSDVWFKTLPQGTRVVLQGNNMPHDDHLITTHNLNQFEQQFPLTHVDYKGQLDFNYPTWSFSRYMLIGVV